jgi:hypothetical protein
MMNDFQVVAMFFKRLAIPEQGDRQLFFGGCDFIVLLP